MITQKDLVLLTKVLATKQDLEKLATKDELEDLKNNVYTKMDAVYKEVLAIRQEQTIHRQEHDDIDEKIEEIESLPTVAHELRKRKK